MIGLSLIPAQEETKNYEAMHPISINTQLMETRGFYGNKIFFESALGGGKNCFTKQAFLIDLEYTAHCKTEFVAVVFTLQH